MISAEERIYGLSMIWREAEYNFALWEKVPDLDWNAAYREFLPKVIAAETPLKYYAELKKFIALLSDGHTYVTPPDDIMPPYEVPFGTSYIEGKHVITELPEECGVPPYSELLAINNLPLQKYLEQKVYPYVWHEKPDGTFKHGLLGYAINCTEGEVILLETDNGSFTIKKNSNVKTIGNFKLEKSEQMKEIFSSSTLGIAITEDNIAYIEIPTFSNGELKKQFYENLPLIKDCKGFVIDVRDNRGGSDKNSDAVAQVFIESAFGGTLYKTPTHSACFKAYGQYRDIENLDKSDPWQKKIYDACTHRLFEYDNDLHNVDDCPMHLKQPLVILSDCNTACATENFLADLKHADRATIVGTNSYGSTGQPLMGCLPGGGTYAICTHYVYLRDNTEIINIGIKPNIYAELTIEDYKNGFDSVFDKGMKTIRNYVNKVIINH